MNKKLKNNKWIYGFMFFMAIGLFSCHITKDITKKYNDIIIKIKKQYAPDSRVALFNIIPEKKDGKLVLLGETNLPEAKKTLLDEFLKNNMTFVDSIKMLPDAKLGNETFGVVRLSVCNVRTKPKHPAELASQAILGTPVNVLKENHGWYYIQTPDGYLGWVDNASITLFDPVKKDEWINSDKVIFTGIYGFVYKSPDSGASHISDIVEGGILKLIGESLDKNYWIVAFPDSRVGYINKNNAKKLDEFIKKVRKYDAKDILGKAKELMGVPYLWGGTSSKMLDCSGFSKTVYFMNGIVLPRDASQQVNIGKKIKLDDNFSKLKPGDLLFFGKNRKDGTERITHVAIYIGNGKIIHETGEVKIQSLKRADPDFVEYRLKSLKQARRIIGYAGKYGVVRIKDIPYYGI